jgi:hypothetical protein
MTLSGVAGLAACGGGSHGGIGVDGPSGAGSGTVSVTDRRVAALNTPNRLTLDNSNHADFFMEREADVLRAIQFMTWA